MSVYKQAGVFSHNLYLFYTQFVFYSTDELYCDPIWYNITWGHALVHLVVELSNLLCTAPEPPYLTTRETSRKRWKVYPNVNIHTHTHIHTESVPAKGDAPHIPPNCLFQAEADCGKLYPLHFPCVPPHPLPFFFFVSAHMHTCQTTKCTVCDLICTPGYAWLLPCVSMMCVWVLKVCKYIHPVSHLFARPFYLHVILHTWIFGLPFLFLKFTFEFKLFLLFHRCCVLTIGKQKTAV